MSTRDFFKERHTIPGSLFLLLIIFFNWDLVFSIIKENYNFLQVNIVSGIALALFGTLGLTIIGFIISQVWFGFFWIGRRLGFYLMGPINPAHKFLKKELEIKSNLNILQVITDYFGITSDKRISNYLSRRLDLLHIIGSSIISIIVSWVISTQLLHSYTNYVTNSFFLILIAFMIFAAINIHIENLKMVEYILLIDYKKRYKFWEKIPKEYKQSKEKKN